MFGDLQNQMNAIGNSLFEAIPEDDEGTEDGALEEPNYGPVSDNPTDSNNINMNNSNNIPLSLASSNGHNDGHSSIQLSDLITSNTNALLNNINNVNQSKDGKSNETNKLNESLALNSLKQNSKSNLNSTSNSANNSINSNFLDKTGDSDIISASPSVISQKFNEINNEDNASKEDENNEGRLVPPIQQIATSLISGNPEYNDSARSNQSNRSNQSSSYNKNSSRSSKSIKNKISSSNSKQNSSALQSPRQLSARSTSSKRVSATSSTSSLTKRQQQQQQQNDNSEHPSSRSIKSNNSNLNAKNDSSQLSSARSTKSSSRSKPNSAISSARSNKEKEISKNDQKKNADLSEIIKRPFSVLAGEIEQTQPTETETNTANKNQNKEEPNTTDIFSQLQNGIADQIQAIPEESDPQENEEQENKEIKEENKELKEENNELKEENNELKEENNELKEENNELKEENNELKEEEKDENNEQKETVAESEQNKNTEEGNEAENNENEEIQTIPNKNANEGLHNSIEEGLNVTDENPSVQVPSISHFPKRTIYEESELEAKLQEFIKTNGKSFPRIPVDMRGQLFQHISRRRVQAIEIQDYDNGEKLMVAQENLRKAMNKDLFDNDETNEESLNAARLSDAKYELKTATERWEQTMKDLNYKLKEQEEQIITAQQAELQKLAEFWSDPSKFHEFNKASSHLLSMREIERNMALTGDFQGAKAMKKRALALEKKETQEAQKRAQEAMEQNFEQMKQKHQMQLDGHRRLAHKLITQEEVKRDYELQPLRMAVKKYENFQKVKIDNIRETKPPPKRNPPVSKSMLVKKTKKDSIILTDDRPPITTPRTMERLARLRETKRAEQLALTKVETKGVLKRQMKAMRPLRGEREPSSSRPSNGTI